VACAADLSSALSSAAYVHDGPSDATMDVSSQDEERNHRVVQGTFSHDLEIETEVAVRDAETENPLNVPTLPVTKKRIPKASNKFGWGKTRGGDQKVARDTTVPRDTTNETCITSECVVWYCTAAND